MIQVATDRDVLANLKDAFLTTNSSGDTAQFVYSPAELLPNDTMTFFRYEGSLTTPPCTEGVTWIVLAEPTYVLEDAIVFLRQHLTTEGAYLKHNWRKTQTLNNRTIYLNKNGVKSLETNILYASCTILLITFEKAVALQRHRYVCRFDFPALDREITNLHLQDETIYRRVTEKEFLVQCKRFNHVWMTMGKSAGLDERFVSRLKLDKPTCPVFYSLIKTHKLKPDEVNSTSAATFKIRPIISCVGGPTDRISWFLNKIVVRKLFRATERASNGSTISTSTGDLLHEQNRRTSTFA
ncbi:hypothetical protein RB195_006848 [Necator americanus]|uniref:carbonic anhydrase n=1 Tax=Necator americanus TaxID=51031 RepID=A0ABR1BXS0_NECAM